jgi:hypothetical protein
MRVTPAAQKAVSFDPGTAQDHKYLVLASKGTKKTKHTPKNLSKPSQSMSSRMMPLPAAKTWDPKNQACNAVYAICMSEARKGNAATADSIIRNIKYSPALEMTTLKLVMRAISKAIMDVYDEALVLDGETEKQHMDRIYIELTAMEEAKEYFEKMAKF